MSGATPPGTARQRRIRIEKDSDAVFEAAVRAGVLSEDPDHERFLGRYMYMHHDDDGVAYFKHRETRAYVTMKPEATNTPPANEPRKPAAGPGLGLWATVVLAGAFFLGAVVDADRGGPRVGTVRLDELTAEFYAETVRSAGSTEQTAEAARTWAARLETALDEVAERHGVVLLPVQAVAAGAGDYTVEVRAAMRWAAPGRTASSRATASTIEPEGTADGQPGPGQ